MIVICDFDGTITHTDTLARIFDAYSGREKREALEAMVDIGAIDHVEQLQQCFTDVPVDVPWTELLCDHVDQSFLVFKEELEARGVSLYIVSSGIREFIMHYLPNMTPNHIYANSIEVSSTGRYTVTPQATSNKLDIVNQLRRRHGGTQVVYVGDGRSDLGVVPGVDVVFAKIGKELYQYCSSMKDELGGDVCFEPFSTFEDIRNHTLFRWERPLHVHFGFGNITLGLLVDHFDEIGYFDKRDTCFVKRKALPRADYTLHGMRGEYKVCVKNGLFFGDGKQVAVVTHELYRIIKLIKLKRALGGQVTVSTALGLTSFGAVCEAIVRELPGIKVHAYENHVHHVQTHGVIPCIADRICHHVRVCDVTGTISVETEAFRGRAMVASVAPTYVVKKKHVLNFLSIMFALLTVEGEEVVPIKVIADNGALVYVLALMGCSYVVETMQGCVTWEEALEYAGESLGRLLTCNGDTKTRLLRNFPSKCRNIIMPVLLHIMQIPVCDK